MGPKKDKKPKTKEMDTQTDEEKQEDVEVQATPEREEKSIQTSLGTLSLCPEVEVENPSSGSLKSMLVDLIKPTENEDKTINTELIFYRDVLPNNKGTYIYDFEVKVNNKSAPFHSLDQVDYFLKHYVGLVENQREIDNGKKGKDKSLFFPKHTVNKAYYPATVPREYDDEDNDKIQDPKVTIIDKPQSGGRKKYARKYYKKNTRKNNKKKRTTYKKSKKN